MHPSMYRRGSRVRNPYSRRGQVVVLVAVSAAVLIGFGALAVDTGRLRAVRAELQRTADAAALAGVTALASDDALTYNDGSLTAEVHSRAQTIAARNRVFGTASHLTGQDIQCGTVVEPKDCHSTFAPASATSSNAVRVTVRRTADSPDGPIPLAFAAIFGKYSSPLAASATAVLDDRFAGYGPSATGDMLLLPFTIWRDVYDDQVTHGTDLFMFDDGVVKSLGDGIREIRLYPVRQRLDGYLDGGGNFGVLNVGVNNLGTSYVEQQILNGITSGDLMNEIGTPEIRFYDDAGSPLTHLITGNTGISAGIKDALAQRVGDVIGFFIHDALDRSGSNATFSIVDIRFARVMKVDLTGSLKNNKGLFLQPVSFAGSGVITDPGAPPSRTVNGIWLIH